MNQKTEMQLKLLAVFQAELEEHVGTLTKGLLKLEESPATADRQPFLADLFRAAHSLKGAARGVGVRDVEAISHKLEDILRAIQSAELSPTPALMDEMLPALDAIQEAMRAFLLDETLPPSQLETLLERLEASRRGEVLPEIQEIPEAENDPVGGHPPQVEASPATSLSASPPRPRRSRLQFEEIIRVATSKLDEVLDSLGELLVVRMRSEQISGEMGNLQRHVDRWQKEWRQVRGHYNRLLRANHNGSGADLQVLLDFLARNESSLKTTHSDLNLLARNYTANLGQLNLVTDDLQNDVRRMRMLPVANLFDAFPRMVRDLARGQGKQVRLEIEGADTEVDRQVLEMMKDPLTHLLRNAVDHGIETPERRQSAGKSALGTIWLKAAQQGNTIQIEVADDGAGIDRQAVKMSAINLGLLSDQESATLDETQALNLIFASGLSTAKEVTEVSGRGVGMDVVRKNLEQLRGLIQVDSQPGQGASFRLTLPLTLATSHVLLVETSGETLAIPTTNIERILFVDPAEVKSVEGGAAVYAEGRPLPLINLAQVLGLPQVEDSHRLGKKFPIVILSVVEKKIALAVDGFKGDQEVVIKNLGRQLSRVRNIAGATILGDGQVVIILHVADLIKSMQARPASASSRPLEARQPRRLRILVVDDSITTRTLEKNILENAGFQVLVAADGREALTLIQTEPLDAVVADIAMPRMDGIALTQAIKAAPRSLDLPVVLVTSLDSTEDKLRGMEAGADAYITKGAFDQQDLLATIERLIG